MTLRVDERMNMLLCKSVSMCVRVWDWDYERQKFLIYLAIAR
jgi:hypothetical protein